MIIIKLKKIKLNLLKINFKLLILLFIIFLEQNRSSVVIKFRRLRIIIKIKWKIYIIIEIITLKVIIIKLEN